MLRIVWNLEQATPALVPLLLSLVSLRWRGRVVLFVPAGCRSDVS
jgi:hypothetical protein